MSLNEVIQMVRDAAMKNNEIRSENVRRYHAAADKARVAYIPMVSASAYFNDKTISAEFCPTTRANCLRSLRTAGTLRWSLNHKKIAFAKLLKEVQS